MNMLKVWDGEMNVLKILGEIVKFWLGIFGIKGRGENMRILDNSRQIPKTKVYTASEEYCDYLYGYLQRMSSWDGVIGHPRYIFKNCINFSRIAKDLGKTRQTIGKKFKRMLEGSPPLIRQVGDKYQLVYLEGNLAMLVPDDTLGVLVSTLKENTISIYVYLLNRYIANGERGFKFSYGQLKSVVGMGVKSHGNNYIIASILFVLEKIGLLRLSEKKIFDEGCVSTEHEVVWMTNKLDLQGC